ncbi:MAG: signal peptidase II [Bacteroidetes bacterium]|nr:signal peptidase II [Bacteroidota bacterium]
MKILYWSIAIVIIDQITKLKVKGLNFPDLGIFVQGMPYQSSIKVLGDFFQITFIENPGMAFGLQLGSKLFLTLFTIFATILIFIIIYKNRKETFLLRLSLAFILGGALGNLIDRTFYGVLYDYAPLFYGRVVDFFHFNIPDFKIFGKTVYTFPIFNVADIAVTVGFVLILVGYKKVFKKKDEEAAQVIDYQLANTNETITETFRDNSSFNTSSENLNEISEEKMISDDEIIEKEHKIIPPNHDETKS